MDNSPPRIYTVHSSVSGILPGYAESMDEAKEKIEDDLDRLGVAGYLLKRCGGLVDRGGGNHPADRVFTQQAEVDCDIFPCAVITYTVEAFDYLPDGIKIAAFPPGATIVELTLRDDHLPI